MGARLLASPLSGGLSGPSVVLMSETLYRGLWLACRSGKLEVVKCCYRGGQGVHIVQNWQGSSSGHTAIVDTCRILKAVVAKEQGGAVSQPVNRRKDTWWILCDMGVVVLSPFLVVSCPSTTQASMLNKEAKRRDTAEGAPACHQAVGMWSVKRILHLPDLPPPPQKGWPWADVVMSLVWWS